MLLGQHTLRLGERGAEDARTVLEEPPSDVRGALLQAPQLRLRRVYFPFCRFERGARLSGYARRRRRGSVKSGEGLRRITDFDFCCEFPLEGADPRGQDRVFLQKKKKSGKWLICGVRMRTIPITITEMVTMEVRPLSELRNSISID